MKYDVWWAFMEVGLCGSIFFLLPVGVALEGNIGRERVCCTAKKN